MLRQELIGRTYVAKWIAAPSVADSLRESDVAAGEFEPHVASECCSRREQPTLKGAMRIEAAGPRSAET